MTTIKTTAYLTSLILVLILACTGVCLADGGQNITSEEVIRQTNQERAKRRLPVLEGNRVLDAIARKRLDDMLEKRYFAHISPSGEDVSDMAGSLQYDYSCIGENLARGNFRDAGDLVEFWMKSPQHRSNILSRDYKDTGVAIAPEGMGSQNFWRAVQVFGKRTRPKATP